MKNYYKILEVSENASTEVIEKAYRVLVKKYHPDLQYNSQDSEFKIKELNEAYNVLSDNFLREQYDQELQRRRRAQNKDGFQETDYGRVYRENQRIKHQQTQEKYDKGTTSKQKEVKQKRGSFDEIVSLFKSIFQYRPSIKNLKNIKKIDFLALGLTIVIVITLGLILYCLPFTHDWMNREILLRR